MQDYKMNQQGLCSIMERNNEAALHIMQREYTQGMEKLEGALRTLQASLVHANKGARGDVYSNHIDPENCSLDQWMSPAAEALHDEDGCASSGFFVYRKPLLVPPQQLLFARFNEENNLYYPSGAHITLMVAMLFNFGLACHLCYLDHEGRTSKNHDASSQPNYGLLQKASQMYDIAIASLRRVPSDPIGRANIVSANLNFFRAAMNNLAICEQRRCTILASVQNESCPHTTLSNKGFDRLRELLVRQPPASEESPETILWNCYLTNILRVTNSFRPNYCAAAG